MFEILLGKYSTAKQLNWQRGFEIVLKLGKCHLFRWIHTLNLFLLQAHSHLTSETRTNLSTLHWWMGKNPLESYWGDYLVTFKGVSQLKLVNETIINKAYQYNIKSDIKLQYECTTRQAFNKITHLAISLYIIHAWFIFEFIWLLMLSWYALLVFVSLTSLSWITPLKNTRKSPQYDSSGFLPIHQCNVDKFVCVSDAR